MTDQPLAPAFLSTQDTGRADQSILLLVGRMDAKLDLLLLADAKQDIEIDKLRCRLDTLEGWRSKAVGGWAVLVAAASLVGNYIINHVWK